jgi:hypothetical protein
VFFVVSNLYTHRTRIGCLGRGYELLEDEDEDGDIDIILRRKSERRTRDGIEMFHISRTVIWTGKNPI